MTTRNAPQLTLRVDVEDWPLRTPFRISNATMVTLGVIVVVLEEGGYCGRGEAAGVDYLGETVPSMLLQIEAVRASIETGVTHELLQRLLPTGGARNALDCALWELDAKRAGRAVWQIAGLNEPRPLLTTYTLGADDPDSMATSARGFIDARAIKLKLTGEPIDAERVRAVRGARQDVWLAVDANRGFTRSHLQTLLPVLVDARVELIEQPFPIGHEVPLEDLRSSIPIAADESVQGVSDLPRLVGQFNMVNIKLDKCGGLTEALVMAREARRLGFELMIGNMVGTSLAMAPAFLIAQLCQVVDLDGPLFLRSDRSEAVSYERGGNIWCDEHVWGGLAAGRS